MELLEYVDADDDRQRQILDQLTSHPPYYWLALDRAMRPSYTAPLGTVEEVRRRRIAPLVTGLASMHHNGYLRQDAVALLARLDHPAAFAFLAVRTGDRVPQVRDAACAVLERQLTEKATMIALPILVELHRRRGVTSGLDVVAAWLGGATQATIRRLIQRLPGRAAWWVNQTVPISLDAARAIAARARDPRLRLAAARMVLRDDPGAASRFRTSSNSGIRLIALPRRADSTADRDALLTALLDRSALVREVAVARLRLAGVDPAEHRGRLLADGVEPHLLPRLVRMLGELAHDATPVLPLLHDAEPAVRRAAAEACGKLLPGPEAACAIAPLLFDPAPTVVRTAGHALVPHAGSLDESVLQRATLSADVHTRRAAWTINRNGSPWRRLLTDLGAMRDPDRTFALEARWHVRVWLAQVNATAYAPLAPSDRDRIRALLDTVLPGDEARRGILFALRTARTA